MARKGRNQNPKNRAADGDNSSTTIIAQALEAVELRAMRFSYQQIADHFGTAVSTAYDRVMKGLLWMRENQREAVEEVLQLELAKLDRLERKILQKIMAATAPAVDSAEYAAMEFRLLAIMGRRARYQGLYKPVKVAPTTPDGTESWQPVAEAASDEELEVLERIARRRSELATRGAGSTPN
jgi:hypothetical protein